MDRNSYRGRGRPNIQNNQNYRNTGNNDDSNQSHQSDDVNQNTDSFQNFNNNHNNNDLDNISTQRSQTERPKREAILDLSKFQDTELRIKFVGGREVTGILKGYDQLMNIVLENVKENLKDFETGKLINKTRDLGLVVIRAPLLLSIAPVDGSEEIENPFVNQPVD